MSDINQEDLDQKPAAIPTPPAAVTSEEDIVQNQQESDPVEVTEATKFAAEDTAPPPEVPQREASEPLNETFDDEGEPPQEDQQPMMIDATPPSAQPTLKDPPPSPPAEMAANEGPPAGDAAMDEEKQAAKDMKPPSAVEPKEVAQKDATKEAGDVESGQAKKEGEGDEKKLKKEGSKREVNPNFKDVHETGSWGGISNVEKAIVGVIGIGILIGVVVVLVVVLGKDSGTTEEVVPAATMAPTPMATSMPPEEKFPLILQELYAHPVTASLGQSLPDDVSFYEGKADNEAACVEMPSECAMSWALYSDEFPRVANDVAHRFALASIYYAMGGPSWTNNTNWLSSTSYCQWHGINCNRLETEVEELDLGENNLKGEIPVELALIDTIAVISMKENQVSGGLPGDVFSALPKLFVLYIQENMLTGPIPDNLINEGKSLALLFINGNDFEGPFPDAYCPGDQPAFKDFSLDCSKNPCPGEKCCKSENCF